MSKDIEGHVETLLAAKLVASGFKKSRRRFRALFAQCTVELELQRSSWDKARHFLNFQVDYLPEVCRREGIREGSGILGRAESIDLRSTAIFLDALDDKSAMSAFDRDRYLNQLVDEVLLPFLREATTYAGVRRLYRQGRLSGMGFASLKDHWDAERGHVPN